MTLSLSERCDIFELQTSHISAPDQPHNQADMNLLYHNTRTNLWAQWKP